jgi:hypothetical protein
VLGAPAPVELELAVGAARAGRELDELGRVGVQHAELHRPVLRRRQRAREEEAVGAPHAAAQQRPAGPGGRGDRRGVGAGRGLGLRPQDPHGAPVHVIGSRRLRACRGS